MRTFVPGVIGGLIVGAALGAVVPGMRSKPALAGISATPVAALPDSVNPEILRIFTEDQADRTPKPGAPPPTDYEWWQVGQRDNARIARIREIYRAGGIRTPRDYYLAGGVLQHSWIPPEAADDHLLAHEFAIVAFAQGLHEAGYLVAASEDRLLQDDLGRQQRFGTQQTPPDLQVSGDVTDDLRRALGVPSLDSLRKRLH